MHPEGDLLPVGQRQPPRSGHPTVLPYRPPRALPCGQRHPCCEQPTWGPISRSDRPLTFSRRASCRCSAVRCAAIGNLLSRISESSPTHRGSCVDHLNAPGEAIEQPLTDQASDRWSDTRKETPGPAPQQQ